MRPKNSKGPVSEDKWGGAGKAAGRRWATPAEDENAASAYWDRWQACCPLYTEGIIGGGIKIGFSSGSLQKVLHTNDKHGKEAVSFNHHFF